MNTVIIITLLLNTRVFYFIILDILMQKHVIIYYIIWVFYLDLSFWINKFILRKHASILQLYISKLIW